MADDFKLFDLDDSKSLDFSEFTKMANKRAIEDGMNSMKSKQQQASSLIDGLAGERHHVRRPDVWRDKLTLLLRRFIPLYRRHMAERARPHPRAGMRRWCRSRSWRATW